MSRVVSSDLPKSIQQFLPLEKTAMPGDNLIHSPSKLPNGVVKISCLGADHRLAGLALKDFKHVTLKDESFSRKIDGEKTICVRVGNMDQLHRSGSVRDGLAVLNGLNLGL